MDRHEGEEGERKARAYFMLRIPMQRVRLHDVFSLRIEKAPREDALKLCKRLFECCLDAMFRPEADEAGIRMHSRRSGAEADVHP